MSSSPSSLSLFSWQGQDSPFTAAKLDPEIDEYPIYSIWLDVLKKISAIGKQSSQYIISLPFPLGVLFCELLENQHGIKKITADKPNRLTILFFDTLTKLGRYSSTGSIQQYLALSTDYIDYELSPRSLEEKTVLASPKSSNHLQKFLEISELIYQNFLNKVYVLMIPIEEFDSQFLKSAVWHHYPKYFTLAKTKKNKDTADVLEFFLREDIADFNELTQKIDRLRTTVQLMDTCHCYSLPNPHLFRETSLRDQGGKERGLSGSRSAPQCFFEERYVEPIMLSSQQFNRLIGKSYNADSEIALKIQNDYTNQTRGKKCTKSTFIEQMEIFSGLPLQKY